MEETVYVDPDGVYAVGKLPEPLKGLGPIQQKRVSSIEPVDQATNALFHWMRKTFGKSGVVISRKLPGPWIARIFETGQEFVAPTRAQCVHWELNEVKTNIEK